MYYASIQLGSWRPPVTTQKKQSNCSKNTDRMQSTWIIIWWTHTTQSKRRPNAEQEHSTWWAHAECRANESKTQNKSRAHEDQNQIKCGAKAAENQRKSRAKQRKHCTDYGANAHRTYSVRANTKTTIKLKKLPLKYIEHSTAGLRYPVWSSNWALTLTPLRIYKAQVPESAIYRELNIRKFSEYSRVLIFPVLTSFLIPEYMYYCTSFSGVVP